MLFSHHASHITVGVRVYPKFRVGLFGLLEYQVSRDDTRNLCEYFNTRQFGYPKVRVRVIPNCPKYNTQNKKYRKFDGGARKAGSSASYCR